MVESEIGGPFCRIEWQPVNLNSSEQIKQFFLKHGWKPTEYNYRKDSRTKKMIRDDKGNPIPTSPKLTEDSFDSIEGDLPQALAKRNVLVHRKRMLKNVRKTDDEETGLINLVRSDGRIGAGGFPCGTPTRRMRHFNVVNIPKASDKVVYGPEIRELFTVPDGFVMVGCDAAALEARVTGHCVYPFKGGPELADLLINGDIHASNAAMWGFPEDRNRAKSPMYCLLYGGQPAKLAQTMGVSLKQAEGHFNTFWETYSALTGFRDALVSAWKKRGGKNGGFIKSIDGGKLFGRSEHSLLNLYIQSTGSISVKVATIFFDKWAKQHKLKARQVLHFHDELQVECPEEESEIVQTLLEKSFESAGRFLNLNVPLAGEAKVGRNWKETH